MVEGVVATPSEPLLVDFLLDGSFAAEPGLRSRLLRHCLATSALPARCWARVLDGVASDEACADVVLEVVERLKGGQDVHDWATGAALRSAEPPIPLPLRLRLHVCLFPQEPFPAALQGTAVSALLAGSPLPPEALPCLTECGDAGDPATLWVQALRGGAWVAAAALAHAVPERCTPPAPETLAPEALTALLSKGLEQQRRVERRACLDALRALRGDAAAAFIGLLSEEQPLHLLEAADPPPPEFHDVAAKLALRYTDTRVHDAVLSRLTVSEDVLLSTLARAAAQHMASKRCPQWVASWQREAGAAAGRAGIAAVAALLALPFPRGGDGLATLFEAVEMSGFVEKAVPDGVLGLAALRALRGYCPELAWRLAKSFLQAGAQDELAAEAVLCCPPGDVAAAPTLARAAAHCPRKDLAEFARRAPRAVAEALQSADAAMALWAAEELPAVQVICSVDGFSLQLLEGPQFATTAWASARAACAADPCLISAYPRGDPSYANVRQELLALGPHAAWHTELGDEDWLRSWLTSSPTRAERLAWLEAVTRLLRNGADALAHMALDVATAWAVEAAKDATTVGAALAALVAAAGGVSVLDPVWPAVKVCPGTAAPYVAQLLGVADVPEQLLEKVLKSSTLSTAVAALHLKAAIADKVTNVPTLASLVVQAVGASSEQLPPDHPAAQLCAALPDLPCGICAALLAQLLKVQLPLLPLEGSPKSEAHHRHVRLWLCVGGLIESQPSLAADAADGAEAALREGRTLPPTRVLLQNVWANAARHNEVALLRLVTLLKDFSLPETFAARCIAVAAQLLLHPDRSSEAPLDESEPLRPLLSALVGWSTTYVHAPRLLASIALFHALERGLISVPGWYLTSLHRSMLDSAVFQRYRASAQIDRLVSDAWRSWQTLRASRPLDMAVAIAQKGIYDGKLWQSQAETQASATDTYQCRPPVPETTGPTEVVVIASLLDNVPNMAGIVRTAESLLGGRAEVALGSAKVLTDPHFQKMSVAAERSGNVIEVPEGERLIGYMREKRADGFTVVALEQTSASVMLDARTQLPRKIVLLVGSEQQGLPAWLVHSGLVDTFLELPLEGKTRSLNAHVASAMVLWHYSVQHQA